MICNAVIESVRLGIERGFMLDSWIFVDYGGSGQGFGGYALYLDKESRNFKSQQNYAGHWLYRCMEIAGVESWKAMEGKAIRVRLSEEGLGGTIEAIGHIIKDDWFCPGEDFKKMREE